ncbi:MAG TPA: cobalamin biosynthesis protein [Gammaproteobacteria bacterium]|nr:cobalamin biosynthesis protein [Gammaproteobacteria bacterium]
MAIISILLVFGAEYLLGDAERVRSPAWFRSWHEVLARVAGGWPAWDGALGVLLLVGLPVLALILLQLFLFWLGLGFVAALIGLVVLYFSLGPRRLPEQARLFLSRTEEGGEGALELAANLLGERPADLGTASAGMRDALVAQSAERLFTVLFWFMVLGPVGALLVRLASFARDQAHGEGLADFAARLAGVLAWIPVRLLALTYGLVGSFEDSLHGWRAWREGEADSIADAGRGLLLAAGQGALRVHEDTAESDDPDGVATALELYHRALAVWLILISLLTLAGWLA